MTFFQIMNRSEHRYRNRKILIAGAALFVLFFLSIVHLFQLRFKTGDLYPPYSSLRSDPPGVKVLYESITSLEKKNVSRNYRAFSRLKPDNETTFFYFGVPVFTLDHLFYRELNDIEALVNEGARVVISLVPLKEEHGFLKTDEQDSEGDKTNTHDDKSETKKNNPDDSEEDLQQSQPFSLLN